MCEFNEQNLIDKLEALDEAGLDHLDFGVIGFDGDTCVHRYNSTEEQLSGYHREFILGKRLFLDIAPCMNNYLIALKFEEERKIDVIIPYILSFKVKPVKVQLRLLKNSASALSYVLIKRIVE